jgi:hypothetical protein
MFDATGSHAMPSLAAELRSPVPPSWSIIWIICRRRFMIGPE